MSPSGRLPSAAFNRLLAWAVGFGVGGRLGRFSLPLAVGTLSSLCKSDGNVLRNRERRVALLPPSPPSRPSWRRSSDGVSRRDQRVGQPSWTVTLFILTGVTGRSPAPVLVDSIFFTTSIPSMTLPNTGCFDAPGVNQSRYELWTVLMKN
jgi:hypothetical protein